MNRDRKNEMLEFINLISSMCGVMKISLAVKDNDMYVVDDDTGDAYRINSELGGLEGAE